MKGLKWLLVQLMVLSLTLPLIWLMYIIDPVVSK